MVFGPKASKCESLAALEPGFIGLGFCVLGLKPLKTSEAEHLQSRLANPRGLRVGWGLECTCVCVCVSVRFSSHVPVFGRAVRVLDFRGGVQGLRSIWFRALNKTQVFSV